MKTIRHVKECVNKLETVKELAVNSERWYDDISAIRATMCGAAPHYLTSRKARVRTKMISTNIRKWLLTCCNDFFKMEQLWIIKKTPITHQSKNNSIPRSMKKSILGVLLLWTQNHAYMNRKCMMGRIQPAWQKTFPRYFAGIDWNMESNTWKPSLALQLHY